MARIVSLHGRSFVHDLVWTRLPDSSSSTIAANSGGADMAVAINVGDMDVSAGFLHTQGLDAKALKKPVSFAALVATIFKAEPSVLLFVTVDDSGDAIMVAAKGGAPVPDYDRYGPAQDLIGTARAYLRENHGSRIISNTELFGEAEDFDLSGFLASPITKKLFAKATLSEIGKSHRAFYLILALVLFAGYIGYDQYAERQKKEAATRLAAQQQSPETIYSKALPDAIAGEGFLPVDAAKMMEAVKGIDVTSAGWRVSKIQ
ncbi:MAG: type 4b pilus protein PilO2, partial [Georgfuchsia sp.]